MKLPQSCAAGATQSYQLPPRRRQVQKLTAAQLASTRPHAGKYTSSPPCIWQKHDGAASPPREGVHGREEQLRERPRDGGHPLNTVLLNKLKQYFLVSVPVPSILALLDRVNKRISKNVNHSKTCIIDLYY
jgi:hypothetical protein